MYLFQHSQHVLCTFICLILCATFQLPLFAHTSDPRFVACVHFVLVFVRIERYCRRKRSFKPWILECLNVALCGRWWWKRTLYSNTFLLVNLCLVTNHCLSLWYISTFRTSLIFVLLFLCLCIPSAPLFFYVSINAFCCLGRGAAHPIKPSTHSSFVSIFVVLLSVWILRMLILLLLLVALALHEPLELARFTINYLLDVTTQVAI